MTKKVRIPSSDQLDEKIETLTRQLGPDHNIVKGLKIDRNRRYPTFRKPNFPTYTKSPEELNIETEMARSELNASRRSEAAAKLAELADLAVIMTAVYKSVEQASKAVILVRKECHEPNIDAEPDIQTELL